MASTTTADDIVAIWGTIAAYEKWLVGKAYKGAKIMGMKVTNWKYGKGSSTPATTTAPAGTAGSKWGSVETKTTYNTNYTTYTKWTR